MPQEACARRGCAFGAASSESDGTTTFCGLLRHVPVPVCAADETTHHFLTIVKPAATRALVMLLSPTFEVTTAASISQHAAKNYGGFGHRRPESVAL